MDRHLDQKLDILNDKINLLAEMLCNAYLQKTELLAQDKIKILFELEDNYVLINKKVVYQ